MNRKRKDFKGCEPYRARLGLWLDGELSADWHNEMESHLNSCASCRKIVEDYRTMAGWVRQSRGLESVAPTVDVFWQRLRGQLPERRGRWAFLGQTLLRLGMQPRYQLVLASAIVLVILAAVFLGERAAVDPVPGETMVAAEPDSMVESVETGVPGASVMVYRSEAENLTVVWLFTENTSSSSIPTPAERHI